MIASKEWIWPDSSRETGANSVRSPDAAISVALPPTDRPSGPLIAAQPNLYDAILLDVDNGPHGLTRAANDGLYGAAGLSATKRALRPGGVLAVWSSAPSQAFTARLRSAGFRVEEAKVRARAGRGGARHLIWLATKPG